jgi:UPF0716 protein FxsA
VLLMPIVEIIVAIMIARLIGTGWTLLALAACSVLGAVLLRRATRAAIASLGPRVVPAEGTASGPSVSAARGGDLALEFAGAVLLVLPGFVTAGVGGLLMMPATRHVLRPLLGAVATRFAITMIHRGSGAVIRGEAVDLRDEGRPRPQERRGLPGE